VSKLAVVVQPSNGVAAAWPYDSRAAVPPVPPGHSAHSRCRFIICLTKEMMGRIGRTGGFLMRKLEAKI